MIDSFKTVCRGLTRLSVEVVLTDEWAKDEFCRTICLWLIRRIYTWTIYPSQTNKSFQMEKNLSYYKIWRRIIRL